MILDREKALEIAKKGRYRTNSAEYSEAVDLEDAIRLHSVGDTNHLEGYTAFIKWAQEQLSSEKYNEFINVIRFPLPTVGITGSIFDDLGKVFEAENSSLEAIRFSKGAGTTGKAFNDEFDFKEIMKSKVFKTFAAHPNSFFVVEKTSEDQVPRVYFIHLDNYLGHLYDEQDELQYLAWSTDASRKHLVVVDSQNFHHFQKTDSTRSDYDYSAVYHGLGFVPADLIYKEFFEEDKKLKVNSPLARRVGELDWLLFWKLAKKVNDKMSPFPIYSHYEFECDYADPITGGTCDGNGNIFFYEEAGDSNQLKQKACPKCTKSDSAKMIAGSRVGIPAPETKDDVDLRDPVQVLNASIESSQYVTKEEERLENVIYYSVVGRSLVALDTFSASETQIDIATESRKNVLLKMSAILLKAHKKIVDTYATYLHGTNYLGNDINYGDNWFLRTDEQEITLYKSYKDVGLPQQMKLAQLRQVIKSRYATDIDERTKQLLLVEIEPFPLDTVTEVYEMFMKKLVDIDTLTAKVYFNEIVEDLESVFGHLGTYLNYVDKRKTVRAREIKTQISTLIEPYKSFIGSIDLDADNDKEKQNQNQD